MTEPIVSLTAIKAQAREAALQYDCINAACPYPFASAAGQEFKQQFLKAKQEEAMYQALHSQPAMQERGR